MSPMSQSVGVQKVLGRESEHTEAFGNDRPQHVQLSSAYKLYNRKLSEISIKASLNSWSPRVVSLNQDPGSGNKQGGLGRGAFGVRRGRAVM